MKRIACTLIALVALATLAGAQTSVSSVPPGEPNPAEIGTDSAQQMLKEVSVTKFEDASFWTSSMSIDYGLITIRKLAGAPADKKPIEDEQTVGIKEQDVYVLGVKVDFFRRGAISFTITPLVPLPIEGISKTISMWVVGRNYNHMLKALIEDYYGRRQEVTLGRLNFQGWKKLTAAVPPSIVQSDFHYAYKQGIKLIGFRVDCDIMESFGTYYLYFDDLRAVTDLFTEVKRDVDDMTDSW